MKTSAVFKAAAKRLYTKGWTKGVYGEAQGPNCAVGAVREVAEVYPGFSTLSARRTDFHEVTEFNDAPSTTRDDVATYLLLEAEAAKDAERA